MRKATAFRERQGLRFPTGRWSEKRQIERDLTKKKEGWANRKRAIRARGLVIWKRERGRENELGLLKVSEIVITLKKCAVGNFSLASESASARRVERGGKRKVIYLKGLGGIANFFFGLGETANETREKG